MTDVVGPGSLKLVVAHSPIRSLDDLISNALTARAGVNDVRRFSDHAHLVFTDAEPSDIRSWLSAELESGESLFVVEFERWSSYGASVDQRWLLRRGH